MDEVVLHDYWRSSASYRVRIALNLKDIEYKSRSIDLLSGQHKSPEHLKKQPQGIVPAIDIDGITLTQSLAIIEYIDETRPKASLLPNDAIARARVRAISHAIAMEIHPVCNLSVVKHMESLAGGGDETKVNWMQKFIRSGLLGVETYLADGQTGQFCQGNTPTMADCCLIPQLYNAERWGAKYSDLKTICAIEQACKELTAFQNAQPEHFQPK
jgi:maleylacetoacetate isomerase